MMKEDSLLADFNESQLRATGAALAIWADFMLDKTAHPGRFEQHFLPFDAIEEPWRSDMPANINRYILRTLDLDVVRNSTTVFVLSKLGKFFVLGFVDVQFPKQWVGTKVHVQHGVVGQGDITMPRQFGEYLSDEAGRYAIVYNNMSDTQREKIEEAMRKDIDRVAKSKSFEATKHDVGLFGRNAFEIHRPKRRS